MNIFEKFIAIIKSKPISILWHIGIGLMASWVAFLVFWIAGAGLFASWVGLSVGSTAGLGIEGYQIVHIKWGQPLEDWLQESLMDISEYILGASSVLTMLIFFL